MSTEFDLKNTQDWKSIHQSIFGDTIPKEKVWTNAAEIILVLNKIGNVKNSNHAFFPGSGGLDLLGASESNENGCIEVNFTFNYILKPKSLIFESIDDDLEWNYFRLETYNLKPKVADDSDYYNEEVCEISPSNYISRRYWDDREYNGKKLTDSARLVIRHLKGSLVIFKKTSIYNKTHSTYDGRHDKFSAEKFKEYIANAEISLRRDK